MGNAIFSEGLQQTVHILSHFVAQMGNKRHFFDISHKNDLCKMLIYVIKKTN